MDSMPFYLFLFIDEFDRAKWEPLTILTSTPVNVPELVMPDYQSVDFSRLKKMVERCQKAGVLNEEEVCQWSDYLDAEVSKENSLDGVEQTVYSKQNGKFTEIISAGRYCDKVRT